jgi:hypothetical protein
MREYQIKTEIRQEVQVLVCDRCGVRLDRDLDGYEFQEALMLKLDGGYGSRTIGDLNIVTCDLCQDCVQTLLGPYWKPAGTYHPFEGLASTQAPRKVSILSALFKNSKPSKKRKPSKKKASASGNKSSAKKKAVTKKRKTR